MLILSSLIVIRIVLNLLVVPSKNLAQELPTDRWVVEFRSELKERIERGMGKDEAGVVMGIVMGDKKGIPSWMYRRLVNSGTIHIMVASGYNVMVVGSFAMTLLVFVINRRIAVWLAIGVMVMYSVLAGWQPPVIRALIMGSVLMVGRTYGRRGKSLETLFMTMVVMFVFDPSVLESISFWLSVSACVGIFWLHPIIESRLGDKSFLFGKTELLSTWSAQVTTMPIILGVFGRMSLIALLSNILILPLVPILMLMGVLAMIIPELFGWPTGMLARLIIELVSLFGI